MIRPVLLRAGRDDQRRRIRTGLKTPVLLDGEGRTVIKKKQPSLALDSHDVPGDEVEMRATWKIPAMLPAASFVGWIDHAIDLSSELDLHTVIISCHGSSGFLHIGKGIGKEDLDPFKRLRQQQTVGRIWIVACKVQTTDAAACEAMAPSASQYGARYCPFGHIDDEAPSTPTMPPGRWISSIRHGRTASGGRHPRLRRP
jgi:hypothetical protein